MSNSVFRRYMEEVSSYKLLTQEEEIKIAKRISKGDTEACGLLVQSNLKLVVKIAIIFAQNTQCDVMDLIQEGNMGLMRAAEKFNPGFNTRFCTYAVFWIKQAISRYLGSSVRQIRLPMRKESLIGKVKSAVVKFKAKNGYTPNCEELASFMNISKKDVRLLMEHGMFEVSSLDALVTNTDEMDTYDFVQNDDYSPENELEQQEIYEMVNSILETLPTLERSVLIRRRQLQGYPQKESLYLIAENMGLSAEGVRQIEIRALKHLKAHKENIRDYLAV